MLILTRDWKNYCREQEIIVKYTKKDLYLVVYQWV